MPYGQASHPGSIVNHIMANVLPASLDNMDLPPTIRQCFDCCWHPDPTQREPMPTYVEAFRSVQQVGTPRVPQVRSLIDILAGIITTN